MTGRYITGLHHHTLFQRGWGGHTTRTAAKIAKVVAAGQKNSQTVENNLH
ncbi:hypothetical protein [Chroococcidiopsis sp. TS-821]|nr:hypothetical protein [Chroococcidiopsis sp. TS-821]